MRQAEVLRDQLLAAFADDPTLQPRDVLVLAPDVATFGPLVEAAFGVTAGAAPIPVRVLDRPARRANVAADVALRLLALADARVDAVQVLDLLAVPAVAARFDLAPADEEALRRWVRESSVRWGLDADDRADRHGLPAEREHTWEFGLDRLLLGWGMPGDGHLLFADALPYDEVEGSDAERLGRFAEGCQAVFDAVRALRAAHPLAVWGERLAAHAEALLVRPPRAGRRPRPDPALVALRDLRGALDALVEHAGGFDAPLSLAAVRLLLEQRFDEPAPGAGAAGAVTMARLVPGRVVPARVVALLGLDEATFPRRRGGAGFDLLATTPRPGCADAPAEDRLRVLEALLAAGDRLLVLYTGRTVDTNEPVAPAVPVGELLDAVDATFVRADGATDRDGQPLPARTLVEWHHALQPFSPRAFEQGAPASHDRLQLAGARALRDARRTPPPFLGRPLAEPAPDERDADAFASTDAGAPVVTVHELADFLARPAKALVAGRLGVWYDEEPELEVADPLVLDALARWALRDDLVQRLLAHAGDDVDDALPALRDGLLPRLRARGALPHGPLGTVTFQALHAEARAVVVPVRAQRASCACPQAEVDATLGAWRLRGAVGAVWRGGDGSWGPGLREATAGTVDAKRLAGFWVRHLALHLAPALDGAAPTSVLVGKPGREPHVVVLGPVADARACLERLLALRDRGLRHPVAYAPAASLAYADRRRALGPDGDVEEAREAASRAWRPEGGGGAWSRAEGDDAYAARLFGDADLARLPDFEATALAVWEPCLAVRTLRKD
jgi:exodeoxyribonuclease V gamma subunit